MISIYVLVHEKRRKPYVSAGALDSKTIYSCCTAIKLNYVSYKWNIDGSFLIFYSILPSKDEKKSLERLGLG